MAELTGSGQGRSAAAAATAAAAVMIAQQVAGKAIRDSFFLSNWPAENLPVVMAGSAILSLLGVFAFTRLVVRFSPARVVPLTFALHAALFVVGWLLSLSDQAAAAVLVYVHTTALGATVVSGFWSVVNERFDPHSAKTFVARIAGGATAGGVIGGVAAWQIGQYVELSTMLLLLAGANVLAAFGVRRVASGGGAVERRKPNEPEPSALSVIRDVPYLRQVALLVVCITTIEACIDYVFKAQAEASFAESDLITFFAIFHAVVASITFFFQTVLARRSLQRLGLAGTVASLPGIDVLGAVIALFVPGVWPLVALRGGAMSVENSLYRSGYELLYTPLSPARKRPTKSIIDVAVDRLGSMMGSGVAFAAIFFAPDAVRPTLLVVAAGLGIIALVLSAALHGGYVSALADSLRAGSVQLSAEHAEDATTRRTLADTAMALDRDQLLEQIAALRAEQGADEAETETDFSAAAGDTLEPAPAADADLRTVDALAADVAALRQGSAEEIRRVFSVHRDNYPRLLVAPTIETLARDDVHDQAVVVLRAVARHHVGMLNDYLLDAGVDFAVRRRIPRVLGKVPVQRSVDGLVLGLEDERFEVRYRCALALYQLLRQSDELEVERERVLAAARREAERGEKVWKSQKILDASLDETAAPFVDLGQKLGHSLEYVFTVLALVLEPEPLLLAYRALAADDDRLRGTGLEYLENVLPTSIRAVLWPYLDDRRITRSSPREREVVVKDLLNSMSSMSIDVEEIRSEMATREGRRAGGDSSDE